MQWQWGKEAGSIRPSNHKHGSMSTQTEESRKNDLLNRVLPKLRPFQREALDFATKGKRYGRQWTTEDGSSVATDDTQLDQRLLGKGRILLADEMGLGKTVTSLAIMAYYESEWPLLILCPASLRYTWPGEIEKFFPTLPPSSIYVAKGFQDVAFLKRKDVKVVILTYSLFQERSAIQQALSSHEYRNHFQCIIADESHNLKSRTSQRSKLLLPLLRRSRRLLLLSGTPALARPAELWTQVSCLAPHLFPSTWTGYANLYCNPRRKSFGRGRFTMDYSGSSNESELHAKLQNIMVRRLKNAVLQELPPKQRSVVPVQHSSESVAECKRIMKELADTRASVDQLTGYDAQSADSKARTMLMQAYQATGKSKAPAVRDYLLDWLAGSNQKILVFAHHKAVLDLLDDALLKQTNFPNSHIRIDGSVPTEVRAQLVRKFQTCARVRVALLSMTAAGVGLTLTAASTVMFAELHWTPGVLAQAEDRAHRIGQTHDSVQIVYMVAKDSSVSIDPALWKLLGKKIRTLDQVVDGGKEGTPYLFTASEQNESQPRAKSAQEELTDFFADTSSAVQKKTPKVPVKGSLDYFFKKAAKNSVPVTETTSRKRQKTASEQATIFAEIACDVCTFNNRISGSSVEQWMPCSACGNLINTSRGPAAASVKGNVFSGTLSSDHGEAVTWSCKMCTLSNSKPMSPCLRYKCDACGHAHVTDPSSLSTPHHARKQAHAVSTGASGRHSQAQVPVSPEIIVLDSPAKRPLPAHNCTVEVIEIDEVAATPVPFRRCQQPRKGQRQDPPEVVILDEPDCVSGRIPPAKVKHGFEFSVSQHSGRITIHFANSDKESSLVNFAVDEVVSAATADLLLDSRIKKSSAMDHQLTIDFDQASLDAISRKVASQKATVSARFSLKNELKSFVLGYLRLRPIEKKVLQESGKCFPATGLSRTVAGLLVLSTGSTLSTTTDRYIGGAKERARNNLALGEASASDHAVLEGKSCAWCGNAMSESAVKAKSTYCSQTCAEDGRLRRGGKFASANIRAAAFALEGGTCALCGLNAHHLFEQIRVLQPPERLNKLLNANWSLPKSPQALEKLLNDPKEGNFWQVDHIQAVAEGGGGCGAENLRTLCVPCHARETTKLHNRLRLSGSTPSASMDIRTIFAKATGNR